MMLRRSGSRSQFLTMTCSLLAVLAILLAACGPQGKPATSSQTTTTPHKGGIWVDDLFNEPDSLIPDASTQTFAAIVDQAIYAPLFYGDSTGHIHAGLATELPTAANGGISSDLKTWTFKLRPNLQWSDGQPLNADDVDFTWKLWTNPAFAAADTVAFRLITSATVSADKLSITFHLSQPYAPFIAAWTDGRRAPMPAHHFSSIAPGTIKKSEGLSPQVVSGPFTLTESKPGDHYTVTRNTKYYQAAQGLPYLDQVIFRVVPDQNTILKDLQAGTVDSAWFLDVTKIASYKALPDYQVITTPSASYEGIHINYNNPVLKDVNVRKALQLAVNRSQLVTEARLGQATDLCTDHGQAYTPGFQKDVQCPKFDLAAAGKLLDTAGWTLGSDNIRHKGNQSLEFQYSTTANNRWREKDQQLIQADFAKIGVKLDITNYPASTFFGPFLQGGEPGKYDLAEWASSYVYDPDDAVNNACSQIPPKGGNFNFYCNPQLDALFTQEVATSDSAKRQAIFNQIHQIYLDQVPFIAEYNLLDVEIVKKGTNNYQPGPFGASETVNIWNWWCNAGRCPA